jgi:hypothetical protein
MILAAACTAHPLNWPEAFAIVGGGFAFAAALYVMFKYR